MPYDKDAQMFCTAEGNCRIGDKFLWVYHREQHLSYYECLFDLLYI